MSTHLLEFDWAMLDASFLEEVRTLNRAKGSLLDDCARFIDETIRSICRPSQNQKPFYNGHKRVHSFKFQSIVFPDGIVVFMDGPYSGNRHGAGSLHDSVLETILESNLRGADRRQLYIYGDPEYVDRSYLVCPFKGS